MSRLDSIFEEYREICFLAKDSLDSDRDTAIDLLAHQNFLSKQQIRELFL